MQATYHKFEYVNKLYKANLIAPFYGMTKFDKPVNLIFYKTKQLCDGLYYGKND